MGKGIIEKFNGTRANYGRQRGYRKPQGPNKGAKGRASAQPQAPSLTLQGPGLRGRGGTSQHGFFASPSR